MSDKLKLSVTDTMDHLATATPITAISTDLGTKVGEYIRASKASNTMRAYRAAWAAFTAWCRSHGVVALPASPGAVAAFLADQAGTLKVSTLELRLAAIRQAHVLRHHPSPTTSPEVKTVMQGIRRTHGTAPSKKQALTVGDTKAIVARLPHDLRGYRDRALLLVGLCLGCRRSELVGLDVGDIDFRPEGMVITITKSKVDQEHRGRTVGIGHGTNEATCPVTALRRWLQAGGIESGPLFRAIDRHGHLRGGRLTGRSVARIVQQRGKLAGLDPKTLGGHSLRSGLCTSAAAAGVAERDIARVTGHKSIAVLRGYVQQGTLFDTNVVERLGL